MNIPLSTYRLQFNHQFTFKQAQDIIPYLNRLGITHCYTSPLLSAKPGSLHGYDVVDYGKINPDIGNLQDFENLATLLHEHKMGLIVDIVPNHMHIVSPSNQWWQDLLENGQASPFANYFDIDWHPPRTMHDHKVLLPILDQLYGNALENQTMKIVYHQGAFKIQLYDLFLPTDPKSWIILLDQFFHEIPKNSSKDSETFLELKSILTALNHLPPTNEENPEKILERLREKEVIKKRLEALFSNPDLFNLNSVLEVLNGKKGDPHSFDLLEKFLDSQPYRLCFWRVANDEINYRRFFDILEYAGIRTEKKEVFDAVHALTFELIRKGIIKGLRIDHIDGLWNPKQYLEELHKSTLSYVIAEKILTGDEKLMPEWKMQGTVGYDFLNQCNAIFVFEPHKKKILEIYQDFTGLADKPRELTYSCKKLILEVLLSSELQILTRRLERIAESHRSSQDFTGESLKIAIRDVMAYFPVYRSYIQAMQGIIHEEDRQSILKAVAWAKRRNPAINQTIFNFIQDLLLLEYPEGLDEEQKAKRQEFVMRFQQSTGPLMAKGLEDTAFYRFYPLASLNEVGGDLYTFGMSFDTFHKKNLDRLNSWPHSMLTTTTHDTKRSEDVRARINILSEIPEEWEKAIHRWSKLNDPYKVFDGDEAIPDRNEEYLIYQTLIGTWPLQPMQDAAHQNYVKRIQKYVEKAIKEAKLHSSWINPDSQYDENIQQFIENILTNRVNNAFLNDFKLFIPQVSALGMLNSLAQVILKFTAPGVPDIYQGNEIWNFSLVDPDNRSPVDFPHREELLEHLSVNHFQDYIEKPEDGRIKLYITERLLQLRQKCPELFLQGTYLPLEVKGKMQNHVFTFARYHNKKMVLVIVGRFFTFFMQDFQHLKEGSWNETVVELPKEFTQTNFTNIFNQKTFSFQSAISLKDILQELPFVVLESHRP